MPEHFFYLFHNVNNLPPRQNSVKNPTMRVSCRISGGLEGGVGRSGEVVFADFFDKRRATHVEQACGLGDDPVRGFHSLANQFLFDVLQSFLKIGARIAHSLDDII